MAEIKSTLELVMERTRNLSMSDEDKRDQAVKEFRNAVNGLALKYIEGKIDLAGFKTEFSSLEGGASAGAEAAAEIAGRIDPVSDNGPLLDLIKKGLGFDIAGIEAVLSDFGRAADDEEAASAQRVMITLLQAGISGSAVIPNPARDKGLTGRLDKLLDSSRKALDEEIAEFRRSIPRAG